MKKFFGVQITCEFEGIYGWGVGYYNRAIHMKWDEYWEKVFNGVHWNYFRGSWGEAGRLVSTNNTIYLHPMGFEAVLIGGDGITASRYIGDKEVTYHLLDVESLVKGLQEAAEYCGAKVSIKLSKEFEIPSQELTEVTSSDQVCEFIAV
ncbi:MAG: hypothetical protein IIZ94_15425 [Prevotella sp.]|nr:hypothetical protein [Prevotella sp.]